MKLNDGRAIFGAVAIIMTGILLALMLHHYLHEARGALTRSRLWWEVALNIQILSVAMMWFCYSDRIENSSTPVKRLQIIRLCFAIVTVLLPTFFGIAGIVFNWFEYQPSATFLSLFCAGVFIYWILGLLLHLRVQKKRKNPLKRASTGYYLALCMPLILLVLITAVDAPMGGNAWLYAIPILAYTQGAMPFIVKAFDLRKRS